MKEELLNHVKQKDFAEFNIQFEKHLNAKIAEAIPNFEKNVVNDSLKLNNNYEQQ